MSFGTDLANKLRNNTADQVPKKFKCAVQNAEEGLMYSLKKDYAIRDNIFVSLSICA